MPKCLDHVLDVPKFTMWTLGDARSGNGSTTIFFLLYYTKDDIRQPPHFQCMLHESQPSGLLWQQSFLVQVPRHAPSGHRNLDVLVNYCVEKVPSGRPFQFDYGWNFISTQKSQG